MNHNVTEIVDAASAKELADKLALLLTRGSIVGIWPYEARQFSVAFKVEIDLHAPTPGVKTAIESR